MDAPYFTKNVGEGHERRRLTLDDAFRVIGATWTGEPFITYDPAIEHQYRIIRTQSSDGTYLHFIWLMQAALKNLLECTSYYKPMGECPEGMRPQYVVGRIRHAIVYGRVMLPCSKTHPYPGQRESITIPVRVEYVPIRQTEPA